MTQYLKTNLNYYVQFVESIRSNIHLRKNTDITMCSVLQTFATFKTEVDTPSPTA